MTVHVAFIVMSVQERLRTFITSVQRFLDILVIYLNVHEQRRRTCVRFWTQLALVGSFATVLGADVLLQQLVLVERFVTFVAFELVFRSVHFKVC